MEPNGVVLRRGGAGSRHNPRAGARGGGIAITQPGFYRGVEVALHQGELCFNTLGSNPKWVPLSGKPSQPCQRCIQKGVSKGKPSIGGCNVPIGQGESLLRILWTGGMKVRRGGG